MVVLLGLLVALPAVGVAERLRAGAGRAVAGRAIRAISAACGIRYAVTGLEHLGPAGGPYVYVPNHASPVDIPALLVARPGVRFVAAAELFRVPLLGGALRALGSVPVDRARPAAAARDALGGGAIVADELVVFAEGGIPEPGEVRRFLTGAFVLAIQTGASIVPVTIHGSADVLPRGSRIWARPGRITVEMHPPIPTAGLTLADRKALRDRTERTVRGPREEAAAPKDGDLPGR